MADKSPTNDDTTITPFVDWPLNWMNQPIKIKFPKLLRQRTRKRYYKTLGTSVLNTILSPLSLSRYPLASIYCLFFRCFKMSQQTSTGILFGCLMSPFPLNGLKPAGNDKY